MPALERNNIQKGNAWLTFNANSTAQSFTLLLNLPLCTTPKRCCSSITEIRKAEKSVLSAIKLCVPMTMAISPVLRPCDRLNKKNYNMHMKLRESKRNKEDSLHFVSSLTPLWKLNQLARQCLVYHLHRTYPAMKLGVHNAEQQVPPLEP